MQELNGRVGAGGDALRSPGTHVLATDRLACRVPGYAIPLLSLMRVEDAARNRRAATARRTLLVWDLSLAMQMRAARYQDWRFVTLAAKSSSPTAASLRAGRHPPPFRRRLADAAHRTGRTAHADHFAGHPH